MMVPPLLAVFVIAIIIILSLACFCFAMAWNRAEAENALLRRRRLFPSVKATPTGGAL